MARGLPARRRRWHRRHGKLLGIDVGADTQLRSIVVREIVETDGRAPLGERLLDRSALS
ncbi:MAG TPA: hypothetical protein VH165_11630 [Kofleriaceae bacterium]|jgi:hypothetical protein|nr:hypothetical protein [Kofleriaceae bacterium]